MILVSDLKAPMEKELGSFFGTEAHDTQEYYRYINEWIRIFCSKYPWYFLQTATTITYNTAESIYPIKETIEILDLIENTDNVSIENDRIATMLSEYYNKKKQWMEVYWIWDTTFISNQVWSYTLIHSVYPEYVDSLTDQIDFPSSVKQCLLEYCLVVAFMSVKDEWNAKTHLDFADTLLPNLISRKSNRYPRDVKRVFSNNF